MLRLFLLLVCSSAYANIDSYIIKTMQDWQVPGMAVGIIEDEKVTLKKSYGFKNNETNEKINNQTLFRIASLSKTFSATLMLLLEQEKKLNLNDSVTEYLSFLKEDESHNWEKVSISNLLSHTTGLSQYASELDSYTSASFERLLKMTFDHPKICEPGECYQYQNFVFNFIVPIAEKASKESFVNLMRKKILLPLGMNNTALNSKEWNRSKNKAIGHSKKNGIYVPKKSHPYYDNVLAAGGYSSNLNDMIKWLNMNIKYLSTILNEEKFNKLIEEKIFTKKELTRFEQEWRVARIKSAHYAHGWRIFDYAGHKLIYHSGMINGFTSVIAFLPEKKTGIVIMSNSATDLPNIIMAKFIDDYLKLPSEDWSKLAFLRKKAK